MEQKRKYNTLKYTSSSPLTCSPSAKGRKPKLSAIHVFHKEKQANCSKVYFSFFSPQWFTGKKLSVHFWIRMFCVTVGALNLFLEPIHSRKETVLRAKI